MSDYTADERQEALAAAVSKTLGIKAEEVLGVSFLNNYNGKPTYQVMIAVRETNQPLRGRRAYVDAEPIGLADDVAKAYFKGKKRQPPAEKEG